LRKKVGKLLDGRDGQPDSRKGLNGVGLSFRVRDEFLQMARADPGRWQVFANDEQPLWSIEQAIVDAVLARLEGRPLSPGGERVRVRGTVESSNVESTFFSALDDVEARE